MRMRTVNVMEKHSIAIQIGRAIRTRRKATGSSQDRFADAIDMHRAYYAAIERGEKKLTLRTLKRVAEGLCVRMSEILRDIDD
jgi:transcriptional regulator with XRE-family HTH domain